VRSLLSERAAAVSPGVAWVNYTLGTSAGRPGAALLDVRIQIGLNTTPARLGFQGSDTSAVS
jgi:hypothetical protein